MRPTHLRRVDSSIAAEWASPAQNSLATRSVYQDPVQAPLCQANWFMDEINGSSVWRSEIESHSGEGQL
jgi:hypothetical protein